MLNRQEWRDVDLTLGELGIHDSLGPRSSDPQPVHDLTVPFRALDADSAIKELQAEVDMLIEHLHAWLSCRKPGIANSQSSSSNSNSNSDLGLGMPEADLNMDSDSDVDLAMSSDLDLSFDVDSGLSSTTSGLRNARFQQEFSGAGILRRVAGKLADILDEHTQRLQRAARSDGDRIRHLVVSLRRDQYACLTAISSECRRVGARYDATDRQLQRMQQQFEVKYAEPVREALDTWKAYLVGVHSRLAAAARVVSAMKLDLEGMIHMSLKFIDQLLESQADHARVEGYLASLEQVLHDKIPNLRGVLHVLGDRAQSQRRLLAVQQSSAAVSAPANVATEMEALLAQWESLPDADVLAHQERHTRLTREAYARAYAPGMIDTVTEQDAAAAEAARSEAERHERMAQLARDVLSTRRQKPERLPALMSVEQIAGIVSETHASLDAVQQRLEVLSDLATAEAQPFRAARHEARTVTQEYVCRQAAAVQPTLRAKADSTLEEVRRIVYAGVRRVAAALTAVGDNVQASVRKVEEVQLELRVMRADVAVSREASALKAQMASTHAAWVRAVVAFARQSLVIEVRKLAAEQVDVLEQEIQRTQRSVSSYLDLTLTPIPIPIPIPTPTPTPIPIPIPIPIPS